MLVQNAISGLFKRLGILWNRAKKATSPDPLYTIFPASGLFDLDWLIFLLLIGQVATWVTYLNGDKC